MKVFVIDVSHCNGCYCCQLACKDEHCGNDWMPYAKPQPDTGHFWGRLNEHVRGTTPKVKVAYVFVPCQHCEDASCIKACKPGAISRRPDGMVVIDPKKCTGCRNCLDDQACQYGAIYFNDTLNIAQKCTGCAHLLDRGWTQPRCADNCPHDSIKFGEESELSELIAKAEVFHPEYGLKPRVYYIGLPKRFIAGTVYDPIKKEIVKGAACTLTGQGGSLIATTDGFGDFWFEGLKVADYSVKIEASGFAAKKINKISTEKDVNLGDIPLTR